MPHPENIIPPKKGEIRNPKGKPKGTKNRSTILKKWIKVRVTIQDKANPSLKTVHGTVEDEIMLALINRARKGDVQAIKEINDTLYGKIPNYEILAGDKENPLIPDRKLTDEERKAEIAVLKSKLNAE